MTTLKDAQSSGDLTQFIAERKDQLPGDLAKVEKAIRSAVKKPKATPAASTKGPSYD